MFLVEQLRLFFADLQDKDYESAIATVHSRFSTNTNPSWERAHPNRFIVHNGEINTIKGNADKMLAREETMESEFLKGELQLSLIHISGKVRKMRIGSRDFATTGHTYIMLLPDQKTVFEASPVSYTHLGDQENK